MNRTDLKSERGSAGVKVILVLLVLFLIAHAGYQYIPVAYQGANFKQDMQTAVINAVALPGINKSPVDVVKEKVMAAVRNNDLPANTVVQVKQANNIVQAHVAYSKDVPILPFGIYNRTYQFDHTATPSGFLTKAD